MRMATRLCAVLACAAAARGEPITKPLTKGDLETSLKLLNLWGERPAAVQDFYRRAYAVLASKPDASYADLAADAGTHRLAREAGLALFGGPMLGAVAPDGARVWVRTLRPAEVVVKVDADGGERAFGPVRSTAETDLTAIVPVTGLRPARAYPYRVEVDGKAVEPAAGAAAAVLRTAPDDAPTGMVRIAFGTCPHRWGLGNRALAERIRSREPAAMLLYGDIAAADRRNRFGLHRADYLLRDLHPAWQGLAASVPLYAAWDDHDYFDNDLAGIPEGHTAADRAGVREVYRRAWNNPSCGFGDERGGIFLRTRIGPCDVIMLDTRYFRENRRGSFLGEDQAKWLEEQLAGCRGPFVLLTSGTMWSDYISDGKDSWGRWDPDGRERILRFIEDRRIPGVLLLSGDRHGARVFRIPRPSGWAFHEFEPASLGGWRGPPVMAQDKDRANQLFGVADQYAFGEFTIDATVPDPRATFRLIADNGATLFELTLTRSELTPPPKK